MRKYNLIWWHLYIEAVQPSLQLAQLQFVRPYRKV